MKYSFSLGGDPLVASFKVGATVIEGQVVIWDTSNKYANVTDASTTAAADAFGVTQEAGTYSTSTEDTVEVVYNPLAVFECVASGAATTGTALSTSTPMNVLVQDTASTTVITDTGVGTIDMSKGIIVGLTGNNRDLSRVITSHSNNTSTTVTVAFPYSVAVNDQLVRLPWAPGVQNVQLTNELDQANAIIATGTGIAANVVRVDVDTQNSAYPTAKVFFALRDHFCNPLS